jgi:hypothetical protein
MAGDYFHYQRQYTRKIADAVILTSTDYSSTDGVLVSCKSANHQVFIQEIDMEISVFAAKVWTFEDSTGTPIPFGIVSIPAAATALPSESNSIRIKFGPAGFPLAQGKGLSLKMSAAGVAAQVHVEAYEKLIGPVALAVGNPGPNGQLGTASVLN